MQYNNLVLPLNVPVQVSLHKEPILREGISKKTERPFRLWAFKFMQDGKEVDYAASDATKEAIEALKLSPGSYFELTMVKQQGDRYSRIVVTPFKAKLKGEVQTKEDKRYDQIFPEQKMVEKPFTRAPADKGACVAWAIECALRHLQAIYMTVKPSWSTEEEYKEYTKTKARMFLAIHDELMKE